MLFSSSRLSAFWPGSLIFQYYLIFHFRLDYLIIEFSRQNKRLKKEKNKKRKCSSGLQLPSVVLCVGSNHMCSGPWCLITVCLWNVNGLALTSIQILHSHQSGSLLILDARGQLILHHSLFFWIRFTKGKNLGTLNLYILSKLFLVKHCCKLLFRSNFSKWLLSTLLNGLPKMSQHVFKYFYPLLFLLVVRNLNCNHGISSFSWIPILVIQAVLFAR